MNDLSTDDPKLTAYALGELTDPAERAQIEELLRESPEARAEVEEILAVSAKLVAEYDAERAAALPPNVVPFSPRRHFLRVPAVLWSAAAALAALAVIVGISLPTFNSVQVRGSKATRNRVTAVATNEAAPAPPAAPTPAASAPALPIEQLESSKLAANPMGGIVQAPVAAPLSQAPADTLLKAGKPGVAVTPAVIDQPLFATRTYPDGSKKTEFAGYVNYGSPIQTAQAAAAATPTLRSVTRSSAGDAVQEITESARMIAEAPPVGSRRGEVSPTGAASYEHRPESAFLSAKENPLSTFGVDVDTASYSNVRRFIEQGSLPPPDAVRIEEMLNYFPYSDAPPAADNPRPFAIHLEAAACPWAPEHRLVRIALKGREMATDQRPASNLVFLIDVSGSMTPPERLPLIKESLRQMVEKLGDNDRVGIVVYAGESGVALPSTTGDHKDVILAALGGLHPGGSTNGSAGITLAYQIAQEHFIKGGVNRVILATDGDFNVGVTSRADLVRQIEAEAKGGVFLSVLGVGTDNLKDSTMQMLADHGNGNYAYLDSLAEGKKVLVEQMSGTLVTIAKDVKIQVEFNPAAVSAYRLIGYEKRALRPEDFNNDRIDAGEIGAGHSVVALYEIAPAGQPVPGAAPIVDSLKYQGPQAALEPVVTKPASPELLTVKVRHKAPYGDHSERSYEEPLVDHGAPGDYANASADWKFSASVASFGQLLRGSAYQGSGSFDSAIELAQEGKGADASGYRAGFIELVRRSEALENGAQR